MWGLFFNTPKMQEAPWGGGFGTLLPSDRVTLNLLGQLVRPSVRPSVHPSIASPPPPPPRCLIVLQVYPALLFQPQELVRLHRE